MTLNYEILQVTNGYVTNTDKKPQATILYIHHKKKSSYYLPGWPNYIQKLVNDKLSNEDYSSLSCHYFITGKLIKFLVYEIGRK